MSLRPGVMSSRPGVMSLRPGVAAISILLVTSSRPALAGSPFPSAAKFSITYTFATSAPAPPVNIGGGRDLTVNRYLVTMVNDDGTGFLDLVAGHCINVRFTVRETRTIDTTANCNFKDRDGDTLYAEYTTGTPKPSKAISNKWTFVSGTGKYFGVWGQAEDSNSDNLSVSGAYQAAGKLVGFYTFVRAKTPTDDATSDD